MMQNLRSLMTEQIRELYSAEKLIVESMPRWIEAVEYEALAQAFQEHLDQTHEHLKRLREISFELNIELAGDTCEPIQELVRRAGRLLESLERGPTRDAGLIAAAQRVEHYEIAAYGTAREFARQLSLFNVAGLLQATLREEAEANLTLSEIAMNGINQAAAEEMPEPSELEKLTKQQLYALAQEKDIPKRSEMTKGELLRALTPEVAQTR